jgi:hypothetical protein
MTNAFGAMDNQWKLWDRFNQVNGPDELVQVTEDPDCTTSQIGGRCSLSHYEDEGKIPFKNGYTVPNYGQDEDVKSALAFGKDAASDFGVNWAEFAQGKAADPPKRNYFVPNFGQDNEIVESKASLASTEGLLGHKLKIPKNDKPTGAGVPAVAKDTALDGDVITTLKNEKAASQSLGQKWTIKWED